MDILSPQMGYSSVRVTTKLDKNDFCHKRQIRNIGFFPMDERSGKSSSSLFSLFPFKEAFALTAIGRVVGRSRPLTSSDKRKRPLGFSLRQSFANP